MSLQVLIFPICLSCFYSENRKVRSSWLFRFTSLHKWSRPGWRIAFATNIRQWFLPSGASFLIITLQFTHEDVMEKKCRQNFGIFYCSLFFISSSFVNIFPSFYPGPLRFSFGNLFNNFQTLLLAEYATSIDEIRS
jgi:hypothetical protein